MFLQIENIHASLGQFFRGKYVKTITAYSCLFTALALVLSSFIVLLQCFGYLSSLDMKHTIGHSFFGNGYLSVLYLGQIIFTRGFCSWSKLSWFIVVVYYGAFTFFKYAGFTWTTNSIIGLNLILIFLTIFTVVELFKVRFKSLKTNSDAV